MILLWLILLLAAGCGGRDSAGNAVLEVRLRLPAKLDSSGATRKFVHVAVLAADTLLDRTAQFTARSRAFSLDAVDDRGCNVVLSVIADHPRGERDRLERGTGHGLLLVLWFCASKEPCDTRSAPMWVIDFDKALWPGERTFFEATSQRGQCSRWETSTSLLPETQRRTVDQTRFDAEMRVSTCHVLGCLDEASEPAETGFCTSGGVHPCE